MFTTPLLQKLGKGRFVTTQSATEDLTQALGADARRKFRFSKFALLNLPPIQASVQGRNTLQPLAIEGAFLAGGSTLPPPFGDQTDLSESLQNYFLNFETLLTQQPNYDPASDQSVAERAFFKWLKEVGAIRFRSASPGSEIVPGQGQGFLEADPQRQTGGTQPLYEPVVRYVGEIDVEGVSRSGANAFRELILYVPTQNGATPQVLFKSLADSSYGPGQAIRRKIDAQGENVEFIAGRDETQNPSGAGLRTLAAYDMDVITDDFEYTVDGVPGQTPWYGELALAGPNAYFTEPTFANALTEKIRRTDTRNGSFVEFLRSRLDGIQINFDTKAYPAFAADSQLTGFNEWNGGPTSDESFAFNAVLLYYDLYDPLNPSAAPVTNLYGVLFLEDLQATSGGAAEFQPLTKLRPSVLTGQQGNGFGFRLNFRFDASSESPTPLVEVSVNDYNTMSMQLFAGALHQLGNSTRTLEYATASLRSMGARIQELEAMGLNDPSGRLLAEGQLLINELTELLADSGMPNAELQRLVTRHTGLLEEILRGKTSVEVSLLLDLIGKDDLALELSGRRLTLRNKRQAYPTRQSFSASFGPSAPVPLTLGSATGLMYHENGGSPTQATGDLYLRLDDSQQSWSNGQEVLIAFRDEVDFGSGQFGILIYTDGLNRQQGASPFSQLVGSVDGADLIGKNRPQIRVVCLDSKNYEFLVMVA